MAEPPGAAGRDGAGRGWPEQGGGGRAAGAVGALGLLPTSRQPVPALALRCTVIFCTAPALVWFLFFFFFWFAVSSPPCPASQGTKAPLCPKVPVAPCPGTQRCSPASPGGARVFCSAFPCAARPVVGGGARFAPPTLGKVRQRLRLFIPGKKPPPRGKFPRLPRLWGLCGHRGVIKKELEKVKVDCTSYAEKNGQTHPIHNRKDRARGPRMCFGKERKT
ncbi:uncharacterized protein LOC115598406 [Calypte anna]|uniref:uncharacterized protein LOC115598406 n=1 Tax=Calypte anna TaxID=9244 RepID=UPI0011C3BD90|nr:uncharacterized protein LOC115598406 [Calypte anna]